MILKTEIKQKIRWDGTTYKDFEKFANDNGYKLDVSLDDEIYLTRGYEAWLVRDAEWLVFDGKRCEVWREGAFADEVEDDVVDIDYKALREQRQRYFMGYCERLC